MTFHIRKIQESDTEGFHAALDSVVREHKFLLTVETDDVETTRGFIRNNIANNVAQFVALIDDKIVGWADILPHQKELLKHGGLLGMGVVSAHRGGGIGKALLSNTIDHARQTGLKRLELEVFANNSVAIALYRQFGFEHEGTKRKARFINDQYEDVCIMAICYDWLFNS